MLRWKAPESIAVYAREDIQVTAQWLDSATIKISAQFRLRICPLIARFTGKKNVDGAIREAIGNESPVPPSLSPTLKV